MKVLVTGHEGYLGAVMVPVLAAAGHEVTGLDVGYFRGCGHGPEPAAIAARAVDIRDVEATDLEGVDAVVHLAGLSNDPLGNSVAPELTDEINVGGTVRLARLARDAGVGRFVFSSSCSLYGAGGGELVGEDAALCPLTPYAVSKVRAEEALHELADSDFSPVHLRNATVYGWSPQLRLDLVLNDFVATALLTGQVRVLSDGTPWRPLIHARDLAEVFRLVLEAPTGLVHDQVFNVGFGAANYQVRDLAEVVVDVVPGCSVAITGEAGADARSYRVDFSKLAAAFPTLAPAWDARRGAEDLVEQFARYGLDRAAVDRFVRLHCLDELRATGQLSDSLRWSVPAR